MYYIYNGAMFPAPPCQTHYKAAVSTDGIHFNILGCVHFLSGYENFVDPTFALLPNDTIMFMAATFAQQFSPQGTRLGIYRAYSLGNSTLNFSALELVIPAPTPINRNWTSGVTDPEVITLSNGTYRIYYDGATDNGQAMAIYSASLAPATVNSIQTATVTSSTSATSTSTVTSVIPVNYNTSAHNVSKTNQSPQNTIPDYELPIGVLTVVGVVSVLAYAYLRNRRK